MSDTWSEDPQKDQAAARAARPAERPAARRGARHKQSAKARCILTRASSEIRDDLSQIDSMGTCDASRVPRASLQPQSGHKRAVPMRRKPGYQSMPDAAPDSPSSSNSGSGASAPYGIVGGRRRAGDPLAFTSSRVSDSKAGCLVG